MENSHSSFSLQEEDYRKGNRMKKSIAEQVEELIKPTVTELGYEIWDVVYSKIGAEYYLEITIDSEEEMGTLVSVKLPARGGKEAADERKN